MVFERGVLRASPAPQRVGDGEGRNGATAAEVSRVDVHETSAVQILNAMNENIRSLREVDFLDYGVARPSSLVSLSLHSNRLSSLEGFASLTVSGLCPEFVCLRWCLHWCKVCVSPLGSRSESDSWVLQQRPPLAAIPGVPLFSLPCSWSLAVYCRRSAVSHSF